MSRLAMAIAARGPVMAASRPHRAVRAEMVALLVTDQADRMSMTLCRPSRATSRRAGRDPMYRHPSSRSPARSLGWSVRAGRGSPPPRARIPAAKSRWLTASASTVVTGPNKLIAALPSGGPSAVAVQVPGHGGHLA
jgi:hypothetical protein